ncbi:unnamed protein product, partial [marine sediment metagenome]
MPEKKSTRRQFIKHCARGAGVVAAAGIGVSLVRRADADKVWQLDPSICSVCLKDCEGRAGEFLDS